MQQRLTFTTGVYVLVVYVSVNLHELSRLGKKYPWPKPETCQKCSGFRLWGHGYVKRYFDGFETLFWIKRYRCPDCGSVHTLRPDSHRRRIQAAYFLVLASILAKILAGRWLYGISKRRQRHWFSGFKRNICLRENVNFTDRTSMFNAFLYRLSDARDEVICSMDYLLDYLSKIHPVLSPHLSFPATESGPSP